MENIHHCNRLGKINTPPKKTYEGFACSTVFIIQSHINFSLFYSPLFYKGYLNYSHSDIYNNSLPGVPKHELGETLTAEANLEREVFVKQWNLYFVEDLIIQKSFVTAPV